MKTIYILSITIIASMLMASCSDEIEVTSADGNPTVAFRISMPRELGTRSDGDATSHINTLEWSLFEIGANGSRKLVYTDDRQLDDLSSIQNVEISLVKGGRYKVTFCAYDSENRAFAKCEDGVVSVDYSAAGSNQAGDDIFVGCSEEILANNETHEEPVVLHRPFAQLNWASSDLDAATVMPYLAGTSARVTVRDGLYTTLDLFSGEVSGEVESPVSFPLFDCGTLSNGSFDAGDESKYKLLAMNYLLTGTESSTINCEMDFSGKVNLKAAVENASVAPNFRTNIYGSLISDPANLRIDMSRAFADNKAVIKHPYAELVERLINGDDVEIPEGTIIDLHKLGIIQIHDKQIITVNGTLLVDRDQLRVTNGKEATINGSGFIKGKDATADMLLAIRNGASLNLSGISLHTDAVSSDGAIYIYGGNANIDGIRLTGNNTGLKSFNNSIITISNSYFNVSYNKNESGYSCGYSIYIISGSQMVMKDCEIDSDCGVFLSGSKLEIEGGSISTRKVSSIAWNHCFYLYEGSELMVKSGKYKSSTSFCIYNNGQSSTPEAVSVVVEGGQYNKKITFTDNIRLADGCEQVQDTDENGTSWYYVRPIE